MNRILSIVFLAVTFLCMGEEPGGKGFYTLENVKQRFRTNGATGIEGVWQFTGEGATVCIERTSGPDDPHGVPMSYNMVIVNSVDEKVKPGTIVGSISPTAMPKSYDCFIRDNPSDPASRSHRFTIRLNDSSHFSFLKVKTGARVSLWRWVPYLFRITVIERRERDPQLDGCIKLFPLEPESFNSPRYL